MAKESVRISLSNLVYGSTEFVAKDYSDVAKQSWQEVFKFTFPVFINSALTPL